MMPIDLAELTDRASLQTRVARKYVVPAEKLMVLLRGIQPGARVLATTATDPTQQAPGGAPGAAAGAASTDVGLTITGGTLVVDSGADGLDADGFLTMTGGTAAVHVLDADGTELAAFESTKDFSSLVYGSADIASGETYSAATGARSPATRPAASRQRATAPGRRPRQPARRAAGWVVAPTVAPDPAAEPDLGAASTPMTTPRSGSAP